MPVSKRLRRIVEKQQRGEKLTNQERNILTQEKQRMRQESPQPARDPERMQRRKEGQSKYFQSKRWLSPKDVERFKQLPISQQKEIKNYVQNLREAERKGLEPNLFQKILGPALTAIGTVGGGALGSLAGPAGIAGGAAAGGAGGKGLAGIINFLTGKQIPEKPGAQYVDLADLPIIEKVMKYPGLMQQGTPGQEGDPSMMGQQSVLSPGYQEALERLKTSGPLDQISQMYGGKPQAAIALAPLLMKYAQSQLNPQIPQGTFFPDMPAAKQQGLGTADILGALAPLLVHQFGQSQQGQQFKDYLGGKLGQVGSGIKGLFSRG